MNNDFVVMICACPPAGCGGKVTPAKSGSVVVIVVNPPLGIHQLLSPLFMSYAVIPPSCFGFRMLMATFGLAAERPPAMRVALPRPSKPPPRPAGLGVYPGGGGSAPIKPQLSRDE